MKCVCGHKHKEWDGDLMEQTHADTEPFIRIKGHFTVETEANYSGTFQSEVSLFSCPVCGTVRMEKY